MADLNDFDKKDLKETSPTQQIAKRNYQKI